MKKIASLPIEGLKQRTLTDEEKFKTQAYDYVIMKLISCEEQPSLMASVLINNLADMISQTKDYEKQLKNSIEALKLITEKRVQDIQEMNENEKKSGQ